MGAPAALTRSLLARKLAAEFVGTGMLLATVVGSGIMAERLAHGNVAIALLGNTIPTGAILVVLILAFGPVSGAHLNPAVSLAFLLRREISPATWATYSGVQLAGGVLGVIIAHAMFQLPLLASSNTVRAGTAQLLSEIVATAGLVGTIIAVLHSRPGAVAYAVGLYITAAYWFTASTSFANPAVTVARTLTDTFTGIRLADAAGFLAAQYAGAVGAVLFFRWLLARRPE